MITKRIRKPRRAGKPAAAQPERHPPPSLATATAPPLSPLLHLLAFRWRAASQETVQSPPPLPPGAAGEGSAPPRLRRFQWEGGCRQFLGLRASWGMLWGDDPNLHNLWNLLLFTSNTVTFLLQFFTSRKKSEKSSVGYHAPVVLLHSFWHPISRKWEWIYKQSGRNKWCVCCLWCLLMLLYHPTAD